MPKSKSPMQRVPVAFINLTPGAESFGVRIPPNFNHKAKGNKQLIDAAHEAAAFFFMESLTESNPTDGHKPA
jgi:hypothetical protein